MCLAVLALNPTPKLSSHAWRWVVVANRDESHDRPTADMQPWEDDPAILAGRDLQAGGGWLGIHRNGRFALLTNYREPGFKRDDAPSRGHLIEQYLKHSLSPQAYLNQLKLQASHYNGFNLLLGQPLMQWWHASNRTRPFEQPIVLPSDNQNGKTLSHHLATTPLVYGLSNALWNTPWPKVQKTRQGVLNVLNNDHTGDQWALMDSLTRVFQDTQVANDHELPDTGLDLARERLLSSPFIQSETYGTRCTTTAMQLNDGDILVQELTYHPDGSLRNSSAWRSSQHGPWHTDQNHR